jgi:hypothetical protein
MYQLVHLLSFWIVQTVNINKILKVHMNRKIIRKYR